MSKKDKLEEVVDTQETLEVTPKFSENIGEFENRIAMSALNGEDSLETSKEIMAIINRKWQGLNGARFCVYKGIKVFPIGEREEIEEEMDRSIGEMLHGGNEGTVETG